MWGIWKIKDKRDVLAGRGKSPPDDDGGPSDESGSGVVVVAGNWTRSISWSFVRSFLWLGSAWLMNRLPLMTTIRLIVTSPPFEHKAVAQFLE